MPKMDTRRYYPPSNITFHNNLAWPDFNIVLDSNDNWTVEVKNTYSVKAELSELPRNWAGLVTIVIIVSTIVGNSLVCVAISKERRLQNMTNYFLMSLAVTDLMVALLVMPVATVILMEGYFPLPPVYCLAWVSLDVLFCTCSIMHLCTISVDRYLSLRYPMKFGRNKTKRRVILKLCIVWLLSVAMSLPLGMLYEKDSQSVIQNGVCNTLDPVFAVVGSVISFFIPLLIMVTTYLLTVRLLRCKQKEVLLTGEGTVSESTLNPEITHGSKKSDGKVKQNSVTNLRSSTSNPYSSLFSLNKTNMETTTFTLKSIDKKNDKEKRNFELLPISSGIPDSGAKPASGNRFTRTTENKEFPSKPLLDNLNWVTSLSRRTCGFSVNYKTNSNGNVVLSLWKQKHPRTKSQRILSCPNLFSNVQHDEITSKGPLLTSEWSLKSFNNRNLPTSSLLLEKGFVSIDYECVASTETTSLTENQVKAWFGEILENLTTENSCEKHENQRFQLCFKAKTSHATDLFSSFYDHKSSEDTEGTRPKQSTLKSHASSPSTSRIPSLIGPNRSYSSIPSQSMSRQESCSIKDSIYKKKRRSTSTDKQQTTSKRNLLRHGRTIRLEQKATKVLGVVFFAFVFLWSPFFVTNLLLGLCPNCQDLISPTIMYIFGWMGYSSSMVNPIFYTIFNRTFRQTFHKILTGKWGQVGQ
ncbi:probable muscarinic acetylcholine receptor gar-2 [Limulus polyphemus]|uniref:Probable muscarinic acetylcholine receptor gar-2 n=1 Tax=Limulus polyphemus TaxID=6850 RepID=A0ABM1S2W0_LIMPO|nr:probable muscarinic acetylcholine receptor gar-2 [Limulus polyphemus]